MEDDEYVYPHLYSRRPIIPPANITPAQYSWGTPYGSNQYYASNYYASNPYGHSPYGSNPYNSNLYGYNPYGYNTYNPGQHQPWDASPPPQPPKTESNSSHVDIFDHGEDDDIDKSTHAGDRQGVEAWLSPQSNLEGITTELLKVHAARHDKYRSGKEAITLSHCQHGEETRGQPQSRFKWLHAQASGVSLISALQTLVGSCPYISADLRSEILQGLDVAESAELQRTRWTSTEFRVRGSTDRRDMASVIAVPYIHMGGSKEPATSKSELAEETILENLYGYVVGHDRESEQLVRKVLPHTSNGGLRVPRFIMLLIGDDILVTCSTHSFHHLQHGLVLVEPVQLKDSYSVQVKKKDIDTQHQSDHTVTFGLGCSYVNFLRQVSVSTSVDMDKYRLVTRNGRELTPKTWFKLLRGTKIEEESFTLIRQPMQNTDRRYVYLGTPMNHRGANNLWSEGRDKASNHSQRLKDRFIRLPPAEPPSPPKTDGTPRHSRPMSSHRMSTPGRKGENNETDVSERLRWSRPGHPGRSAFTKSWLRQQFPEEETVPTDQSPTRMEINGFGQVNSPNSVTEASSRMTGSGELGPNYPSSHDQEGSGEGNSSISGRNLHSREEPNSGSEQSLKSSGSSHNALRAAQVYISRSGGFPYEDLHEHESNLGQWEAESVDSRAWSPTPSAESKVHAASAEAIGSFDSISHEASSLQEEQRTLRLLSSLPNGIFDHEDVPGESKSPIDELPGVEKAESRPDFISPNPAPSDVEIAKELSEISLLEERKAIGAGHLEIQDRLRLDELLSKRNMRKSAALKNEYGSNLGNDEGGFRYPPYTKEPFHYIRTPHPLRRQLHRSLSRTRERSTPVGVPEDDRKSDITSPDGSQPGVRREHPNPIYSSEDDEWQDDESGDDSGPSYSFSSRRSTPSLRKENYEKSEISEDSSDEAIPRPFHFAGLLGFKDAVPPPFFTWRVSTSKATESNRKTSDDQCKSSVAEILGNIHRSLSTDKAAAPLYKKGFKCSLKELHKRHDIILREDTSGDEWNGSPCFKSVTHIIQQSESVLLSFVGEECMPEADPVCQRYWGAVDEIARTIRLMTEAYMQGGSEWSIRDRLIAGNGEPCQECNKDTPYASLDLARQHIHEKHETCPMADTSCRLPNDPCLAWVYGMVYSGPKDSDKSSMEMSVELVENLSWLMHRVNDIQSLIASPAIDPSLDTTDGSSRPSLPRSVVLAFEEIFNFLLFSSKALSSLHSSKMARGRQAREGFLQQKSKLQLKASAAFNSAKDLLNKASRDVIISGSKVRDVESAGTVDVRAPFLALALVAKVQNTLISTGGAQQEEPLSIYKRYMSELYYRANRRPKRKLFAELYAYSEELKGIGRVTDFQIRALDEFKEALDNLERQRSWGATTTDLTTHESVYLKKQVEKLERRKAEIQALESKSQMLRDHVRQMVEILDEGHGRAIRVFTIVTLFFLPLSFVTSFMGMNTTDMRDTTSDQRLFWAAAVPITTLTLGLAFAYGYRSDELEDWFKSILRRQGPTGTLSMEKLRLRGVFGGAIEERDPIMPNGNGTQHPGFRTPREGRVETGLTFTSIPDESRFFGRSYRLRQKWEDVEEKVKSEGLRAIASRGR